MLAFPFGFTSFATIIWRLCLLQFTETILFKFWSHCHLCNWRDLHCFCCNRDSGVSCHICSWCIPFFICSSFCSVIWNWNYCNIRECNFDSNYALFQSFIYHASPTLFSVFFFLCFICSYLGGLMYLTYKLPFVECLMFGALISATDPVTVLSIFQVILFLHNRTFNHLKNAIWWSYICSGPCFEWYLWHLYPHFLLVPKGF